MRLRRAPATVEPTPEDLRVERQRLAYEASIGTPGAADELDAIEARLAALAHEATRAQLVLAETAKREREAEAAAASAARREQVRRHRDVTVALRGVQEAIGGHLDAVAQLIRDAAPLDAERAALASELFGSSGRLFTRHMGTYLASRLLDNGVLDGVPYVRPSNRIRDLVGADPVTEEE
jgi:hypothetical protein